MLNFIFKNTLDCVTFAIIIVLVIVSVTLSGANRKLADHIAHFVPDTVTVATTDTVYVDREMSEWDMFTMALAEVETRCSPGAISKGGDYGLLQIRKPYLDEYKRLGGNKVDSLGQLFDVNNTLEVFNLINAQLNPDYDILKAIRIHNPGAPSSYTNSIILNMERIRRTEKIRKYFGK